MSNIFPKVFLNIQGQYMRMLYIQMWNHHSLWEFTQENILFSSIEFAYFEESWLIKRRKMNYFMMYNSIC